MFDIYAIEIIHSEAYCKSIVAFIQKYNIPKEKVYQSLDDQIKKLKTKKIKVCDGEIIAMDQLSLHRATKTHQPGVRFFLRLAILHNLSTTILQTTPQNEVRHHLHIYKEMP